jgi:hypothetical protein
MQYDGYGFGNDSDTPGFSDFDVFIDFPAKDDKYEFDEPMTEAEDRAWLEFIRLDQIEREAQRVRRLEELYSDEAANV